MIALFLLLSPLLSSSLADDTCPNGTVWIDLYKGPVYVPRSATVSQTYAPSQKCTWGVVVPTGSYVSLYLNANLAEDDVFSVYNPSKVYFHGFYGSKNSATDLSPVSNSILNLPADSFTIQYSTGNLQGHFLMRLELRTLPKLPAILEDPALAPVHPLSDLTKTQVTFYSSKTYTIRTITQYFQNYRYDSCFVYQGNTTSGSFISGLDPYTYGLYPRFTGYTTAICIDGNLPIGYIMASTVDGMETVAEWDVMISMAENPYLHIGVSLETITSSSTSLPVYFTTFCSHIPCYEYIDSIVPWSVEVNNHLWSNKTGTFAIYYGIPATGMVGVESITGMQPVDFQPYTPQKVFGGPWRTYRPIGTNFDLWLQYSEPAFNSIANGSSLKGFFSTANYGFASSPDQQNQQTNMQATELKNIQLVVKYCDQGGVVKLTVQTDQNATQVTRNFDANSNDTVWNIQGYGVSFQYIANTTTKGALVSYDISWIPPPKTCSSLSVTMLLTFLVSLWIH